MYSFFSWENIEITDKKGLFDWLMSIKDDEEYGDWMFEDYLVDIIDKNEFSFENWDNIKLISYWYKEQIKFLDKISDFIEGEVRWTFESDDESAFVKFKDGETIFNLGIMEFKQLTAEELRL